MVVRDFQRIDFLGDQGNKGLQPLPITPDFSKCRMDCIKESPIIDQNFWMKLKFRPLGLGAFDPLQDQTASLISSVIKIHSKVDDSSDESFLKDEQKKEGQIGMGS